MKKILLASAILGLVCSVNAYASGSNGPYEAHVTLVNKTDYLLTKTSNETSYQIKNWKFPSMLPAQSFITTHFKFKDGYFTNFSDDKGSVEYQTTCPDKKIETILIKADITPIGGNAFKRLTTSTYGGNCVSVAPTQISATDWGTLYIFFTANNG